MTKKQMKQQQSNVKGRAQRTQQLYVCQICNENKMPESWQFLTEVGRLIKAGVNISAPEPEWTPLHRATHEGKIGLCTVCRMLIEHKADVNEKSETKRRPK
jgi:hypothetical protein